MRWRRRRRELAAGFRPGWRDIVRRRVRSWDHLTDVERERLEQVALELLVLKRWEPANGFELTDEIRVTIAAEAALLVLGLPGDPYRLVQSIIVHPTTVVMRGTHSQVRGTVSVAPMPILGLSEYRGAVAIAWDAAADDARHPGTGHNVVFHEFAHQLDMLDGTVDGTPPLATPEQYQNWVEVCTRVYVRVVEGTGGRALSSYAGVNPGEFFAVATEVFFDDPHALIAEHPDLYGVLADFYRQDPAARIPDRT